MKPVVTLKEWGVVAGSDDPYMPPEVGGIRLKGSAYGHPRHKDGEVVKTGVVQKVDGRIIETTNTVYVLEGPPHPVYLQYLAEHGIPEPSVDHPIKLRAGAGCTCRWVAGLGQFTVGCPIHG